VLDGGQLIRFLPHQHKVFEKALKLDQDGRLPYSTILYSCVKKSGKTTLNACVACWFAYELAPGTEIIVAANDLEQAAGRVYRMARNFIERNPILYSEVMSITQREITLKNGTTIKAIPSDATGEAGANQSLSSFDELWGYTSERSRRLFEELTPVPTLKNSARFISTYAGYVGESDLLEDLYRRGKSGRRLWTRLPCWENGRLFMYWDSKPRMPWQTPEYYREQREDLRPIAFMRLHRNQWVSSENALFDMAKWDACVDKTHKAPLPDKNIRLFIGVDASVKKDRSAVVSVYFDNGRLMLGPKRWWQPSRKHPMDLEATIEAYLLQLARGFTVQAVLYDPFQFHRSATTLKRQGLPMREFPQSVPNLTQMGSTLYDLVESKNITLYPCKDLRGEAAVAVAKERDRGLQITKDRSGDKIDQIVALAMCAFEASCCGDPGPGVGEVHIQRSAGGDYEAGAATDLEQLMVDFWDNPGEHYGGW